MTLSLLRNHLALSLFTLWAISAATLVLADKAAKNPRAKPKTFSEEEVSGIFFENVFDELVGSRPDLQKAPAVEATAAGNGSGSGDNAAAADGSATSSATGWSQIISSTTIENEIKAIKLLVDQDVSTPSDFRGRGYELCRTHFSVAAALFAIIHEYDGDVRWKEDAAAARDAFARTASNAKVGTAQVFNEAKQRKVDLQDLLTGNGFAGSAASPDNDWTSITDRAPLMVRLEKGFEEIVRPATGSESEFKANKEKLLQEAELIAAIAAILSKEGMEDGDDEEYKGFADTMRSAARDVVAGIQADNYDQVRTSANQIDQTCNNCHDTYR